MFRNKFNSKLSNSKINLYGFGKAKSTTLGSFEIVVNVDEVQLCGQCHVVDSKTMEVELILGDDIIKQWFNSFMSQ